jgi:hypothetical protein
MDAVINKKQTAFRLSTDLLDRLKIEAKKENRSLNNYVENLLMNVAYKEPNGATLAAMEEAKAGKYAGTINTSSMEAFIKSCEE